METKVEFYKSEKALKRGIARMQLWGWTVASTQAVTQGYNPSKTCCLGVLFLPLALLGKRPDKFQVTYQRPKEQKVKPQTIPVAPAPVMSETLVLAPEPARARESLRLPQVHIPDVHLPQINLRDIHVSKLPIGCLLAAGIASIALLVVGSAFLGLMIYIGVTATPTPIP